MFLVIKVTIPPPLFFNFLLFANFLGIFLHTGNLLLLLPDNLLALRGRGFGAGTMLLPILLPVTCFTTKTQKALLKNPLTKK